MLLQRLSILTTLCFLTYLLSSETYLNEFVIVNLEFTITSQSKLNRVSDDIATMVDTAYRAASATDFANIFNIDTIEINSSYGYFNQIDESIFEYAVTMKVYWDSENAYTEAVDNGYKKSVSNSPIPFVIQFETDLKSAATSSLNMSAANSIDEVVIQSMRIISFDVADQTGRMWMRFNGYSATATRMAPTGITANPSTDPTLQPSASPTKHPVTTSSATSKPESVHYSFDNEALYWVIAVLFLFVGCCFGCGCWGYLWVKTDIRDYFEGKRKTNTRSPAAKPRTKQRKTPRKERRTSESIELQRKKKYEAAKRAAEREELQKKRDRYIEYGSDDDSDKAKQIFRAPPKRERPVPTSSFQVDGEGDVSTSEDIKLAMRKVSYSTPSVSDKAKSPRRPKHRNKNKKTGNVEPIRYDEDGSRQLTTKELMMQYKKNRQKGGQSVDLSYKVGGVHRSQDDNDIQRSQSRGDSAPYGYDVEDLEDVNHPHYKPSNPRKKIKSADRKHKRKRKQHQRSATGGINDGTYGSGSPKAKYRRPKTARPNEGKPRTPRSPGSRSKGKKQTSRSPRPQSARPGTRAAHRKSPRPKKKRSPRYEEEYDEEYAYAYEKPKPRHHHHQHQQQRHDDYDDYDDAYDGNSGSAESY